MTKNAVLLTSVTTRGQSSIDDACACLLSVGKKKKCQVLANNSEEEVPDRKWSHLNVCVITYRA